MKTTVLSFKNGVARAPSDNYGSENTLSDCLGLMPHGNSLCPVQDAVDVFSTTITARIILVHTTDNNKRYVAENNGSLVWFSTPDTYNTIAIDDTAFDATHVTKGTAIGNTVILLCDSRPYYFLWNNGSYKSLGSNVPAPKMRFVLAACAPGTNQTFPSSALYMSEYDAGSEQVPLLMVESHTPPNDVEYDFVNSANVPAIGIRGYNSTNYDWESDDVPQDFKDSILGLYAENLTKVAKQKGFCNPFFVRYAVRLYDDSYTHISQPILMIPSLEDNSVFFIKNVTSSGSKLHTKEQRCYTTYKRLYCLQETDYRQWGDVVSGIDVFITRPTSLYKSDNVQFFQLRHGDPMYGHEEDVEDAVVFDSFSYFGNMDDISVDVNWLMRPKNDINLSDWRQSGDVFGHALCKKDWNTLSGEMIDNSVFRKLAELPIHTEGWVGMYNFIKDNVVENIDVQDTLGTDDYYGHTDIYAESMYAYNGRLHLMGLRRSFFDGFKSFSNVDLYRLTSIEVDENTYDWPAGPATATMKYIYVTIHTDDGDRVVKTSTIRDEAIGLSWFYYPDPRATKVSVFSDSNTLLVEQTLKEHPLLNGAYCLLKPDKMPAYTTSTRTAPTVSQQLESLPGQIAQSEANNPWVYSASGYHTISDGKVLAMCTTTHALSEGQFGAYPLLVFTTEGIWAMATGNTGEYTSIKPMSRDVLLNPDSIVEVDNAVFFVSAKGLMRIVGNAVTCVSGEMAGKTPTGFDIPQGSFMSQLAASSIAYDYRDRTLWIFQPGAEWAWLYHIEAGAFTRKTIPGYRYHLRDYPDTLLVSGTGPYSVSSLLNRVDPADDTASYSGRFVTRPLTFGSVLSLKTVNYVRHVTDAPDAAVEMIPYGSNDLATWTRLYSLRGKAWRFYRFVVDISGMTPADTYDTLAVVTDDRRTNHIR